MYNVYRKRLWLCCQAEAEWIFCVFSNLAKIQGPARYIGLNCMYDLPNILTSKKWCAMCILLCSMLGFRISIRNMIDEIFEI